MKKTLITLALIALILSTISITALAHCGGRGFSSARQATTTYSYELCPFDDCYLSGNHEHDGAYYRCAHTGYCGGAGGYCGGYNYNGNYDNNTNNSPSNTGYSRPIITRSSGHGSNGHSYRHGGTRVFA